jgi:LPXTG-motif cell wall-anchored protein
MKKILCFVLMFTFLMFNTAVLATEDNKSKTVDNTTTQEETTKVVGEDIEIGEGEMKIVSVTEEDKTAVEETDKVVGDDIEIGEGEVKIVSVNDSDSKVVGDDIKIGDGEFKIISMPMDESKTGSFNMVYAFVAAGAVIVLAGGFIVFRKRRLN